MAEPTPAPDTSARALAAIVGVLTDIQLAVLAAAVIVEGIVGPRGTDLLTLLVALSPSLVRLARRGRRLDGARGWAQAVLDVVTAVAVLATVGSDSLVLVYIAPVFALCGLERGQLGALLAAGVLAGVHLLAVVGLTADADAPAGVLVVLIRLGLLAVAGFGSLRLREVILQREQLSRAYAALEQQRLREAERTRLAREMHDSLAKSLHGMRLLAGHLASRLARERHPLAGQAELIASSVEQGLFEARRIIQNLREAPVESLRDHLARAVPAWSAEHGVRAELDLPAGEPELAVQAREELAKAVAELLENVARHAGARRVSVTLAEEEDGVRVSVADDGRGMPAPDLHALYRAGHFGLVGVSERMARVGGSVEIDGAGPGTTVSLRVTLPRPDSPDTSPGEYGELLTGVVPVHAVAPLPDAPPAVPSSSASSASSSAAGAGARERSGGESPVRRRSRPRARNR